MRVELLRALIDQPERRAEVNAVDLVQAFFEQMSGSGELNAFITLTERRAADDAERVDRARRHGSPLPLDGLAIVVKDNIDISGYPTTGGSRLFQGRVAERDADVVQRISEAGGVVLAKTNLHELAFGASNDNPVFGPCFNPWGDGRVPGGSSGGSAAAVAADLCMGALGTDTGGSVRLPAAFTGITGLRPTLGSVSVDGIIPLSTSLDTVGPLARSAVDVAALLDVMSRSGDRLSTHPVGGPPQVIRVGVARHLYASSDREVVDQVERATAVLEDCGARLSEVTFAGFEQAFHACGKIIAFEAFGLYGRQSRERPELFGADVKARLAFGEGITPAEHEDATRFMLEWARTIDERLRSEVDVVITPTSPTVAPTLTEARAAPTSSDVARYTRPWGLAGVPALSVPCGLGSDGMPVAFQAAASRGNDRVLLDLACAFQQKTDWHRLRAAPSV